MKLIGACLHFLGYFSLLHSAAWDRSRLSKWWRGPVPVRWTVYIPCRCISLGPLNQVHKLKIPPDFPSPLVLRDLPHQLLGSVSCLCGQVTKFKCIFLYSWPKFRTCCEYHFEKEKYIFATLNFLLFQMILRIALSNSRKNWVGIWIGIALNL